VTPRAACDTWFLKGRGPTCPDKLTTGRCECRQIGNNEIVG
jgi:hypothetical protein